MGKSLFANWQYALRNWWKRLTEPAAVINDPNEQRTARLLSALLLLTVVILVFGRFFRAATQVSEPSVTITAVWLNIAVLAVAYAISRTRYVRWSALLAITVVSGIVFLQSVYRGVSTSRDLSNPAAWLVALLLLSSFVISWRMTLALGVAYLAGLLMLPRVVPQISYSDVRFSVELIFALSLVISLAAYLRRRDMRVIQTQTEELIESEDRYRMLFAAAFEGIVIHDNGVVIDVNDAFQAMFGYSRDEMIGAQVLNYVPSEWHAVIFEKADANIMTYEIPGLRKSGVIFPMEVSVKRVIYKGKLLRVVAMRDITERKHQEAERIQLITERERAQVLRQFISDASHDLRQPLTTMNTSLYLLRRKSSDLGETARHVDTLDTQVAYLTRLLEDLFAMSRLDEPELFMERVPLDLNQLVARIIQDGQSPAGEKGIQMDFAPCETPLSVQADHIELRRALKHILTNALSYTHDGGKITVRTVRQGDSAIVEIEDTGIGISPDDLPYIFNRFYRADHARQTETGGSGLGLAIAQKIVEHHNGSINVQSTLGSGSTFSISLPIPAPIVPHPSAQANGA